MKKETKVLTISVLIPLVTGAVSGFLTKSGMKSFGELIQPKLSPPGWLFPIVWTILYVLMGIASFLVYRARIAVKTEESKHEVRAALTFYGIQLAFNFCWSLIFFNMRQFLFAFYWLAAMWILILITMYKFVKIEKRSVYLMIPYVLWVTFAGYLNLAIFSLNR